jgi:GntR family transcriptional regulator
VDAINRQSKLPLYQQLYEVLRGNITRGEWKPGDLIPAESELIEQYGVSRITVRQVLDMLVQEGLIYRQRGRGSFVAHPTVEQVLQRLVSFTDDMRQRGFAPNTRVLSSGLLPAPEDIARHLQVAPGEELARIERVRLADGEPMSVEEAYLVHRFVPGILQQDFVTNPMRELIDRQYNIRWERARQVIRAINATRVMAETLAVKPNAALLFIERVSYSQQGVPVEFLRVYHRGDRYALHSELRG